MKQDEILRRAVDNEPVPRDLEARVRTRLEGANATVGRGRLLSSAALLMVMLAGIQYYVVRRTHELLQIGANDHVHCAMGGVYPKQDSPSEAVKALGPYSLMLQPIMEQFPGDSFVSAHRCTANGRTYVHVILRRNDALISVIMTRGQKDEAFPKGIWTRGNSGSIEGYSVAGFKAGNYLGYVVSGLPGQQNNQLAGRVAPVIRRYTGA